MPDISMCANEKCKKKYECYRFMAVPNKWRQSYMDFKPHKNGKCDSYWPIDKATTAIRENDPKKTERLIDEK